jgi:molybdopterin/thiamine biosynthesis adenylyltransferase/DNA-binding transcriptional regulator YhcF (GntR family)
MLVRPVYKMVNMKIEPVSHKTLAEGVAGRLAASLLDGRLKPGERLPSERELIGLLDVSRATLREGLKALEQNRLIEAQAGVGWFARTIDGSNVTQARELAEAYTRRTASEERPASAEPPTGPRRLPTASEKPLHIPNLRTDRLGTFELISWWERAKVQSAKVLVVGAGALGNEVIKNLALMGVGHIFVVDFDTIEAANLSRSVLFRESDSQRSKAQVAAARARSLNPGVRVQYLHGDVTADLGLGVIRRMDAVIGCLDNREARLSLNRFCYWMGKPWVDGAIQELLGLVRVFVPGQGACYECTLTEQARVDLALRYSCPLLARENILLGKVPTTPTIASMIGGMQAQEALKLIHGLGVEPGKVIHFNGMTNEMHTTAYLPRDDCESHWSYGEVTELPAKAESTTLEEMLRIVRADLGPEAILELDQELVIELSCPSCGTKETILRPLPQVTFEAAHCPNCGLLRESLMTHQVTGPEGYLHRTLASVGVPPLHILRARNGAEYRFYELTGDLAAALHFRHFEGPEAVPPPVVRERIRMQDEEPQAEGPDNAARGRVVLRD